MGIERLINKKGKNNKVGQYLLLGIFFGLLIFNLSVVSEANAAECPCDFLSNKIKQKMDKNFYTSRSCNFDDSCMAGYDCYEMSAKRGEEGDPNYVAQYFNVYESEDIATDDHECNILRYKSGGLVQEVWESFTSTGVLRQCRTDLDTLGARLDTELPAEEDHFLCYFPYCGNGVVDANEDCEDGNLISGDGCSSLCQWDCPCGSDLDVLPFVSFDDAFCSSSLYHEYRWVFDTNTGEDTFALYKTSNAECQVSGGYEVTDPHAINNSDQAEACYQLFTYPDDARSCASGS